MTPRVILDEAGRFLALAPTIDPAYLAYLESLAIQA